MKINASRSCGVEKNRRRTVGTARIFLNEQQARRDFHKEGVPFHSVMSIYQCEECGFHYEDDSTALTTGKKQAERCEAWCKEHKSCNIEITASAIENKKR